MNFNQKAGSRLHFFVELKELKERLSELKGRLGVRYLIKARLYLRFMRQPQLAYSHSRRSVRFTTL